MNCSPNCSRTIVNKNTPRDFRNPSVFIDRAPISLYFICTCKHEMPRLRMKRTIVRGNERQVYVRERSHTVPVSFCSAGTDKCQLVKSNFLLVTVSRKSDVRYQERYLSRRDSRFLDRTYWKSLICEKNTVF